MELPRRRSKQDNRCTRHSACGLTAERRESLNCGAGEIKIRMKQDYRVDRADGATTYFAFTDTTDDSILRDIGLSDSELFKVQPNIQSFVRLFGRMAAAAKPSPRQLPKSKESLCPWFCSSENRPLIQTGRFLFPQKESRSFPPGGRVAPRFSRLATRYGR